MPSPAGSRPWCLTIAFAAGIAFAAQPVLAQTVRLPDADRPLQLRQAELYSVGTLEGSTHEEFARVMAVAFDAADNLYVLDGENHRVVVFGPDGRHLRTFGRNGGGPGEFQSATAIVTLADGEVLVADAMRADLQRFGLDGSVQGSFPLGQHRISSRMQAHPAGGFIAIATSGTMRIEGSVPPLTRELRWFRDGDSPTSVYAMRPLETAGTTLSAPADGRGRESSTFLIMNPPVFAPTLNWGVLPNGHVAVNGVEDYRVEILDVEGRVVKVLERSVEPRRVTERDKEAYRSRAFDGGGFRIVGAPGDVAEQLQANMLDALTFAERLPAIRSLQADPLGRLWVVRYDDPGSLNGSIDLIDVVNDRYLGTLPPQRLPDAFSSSGRVAYIESGEFDVPRVVVGQLPAQFD